jgi:hypothetical protein
MRYDHFGFRNVAVELLEIEKVMDSREGGPLRADSSLDYDWSYLRDRIETANEPVKGIDATCSYDTDD